MLPNNKSGPFLNTDNNHPYFFNSVSTIPGTKKLPFRLFKTFDFLSIRVGVNFEDDVTKLYIELLETNLLIHLSYTH